MKRKYTVLKTVLVFAACIMTGATKEVLDEGGQPLQEATSVNTQLQLGVKQRDDVTMEELAHLIGSVEVEEDEELDYEKAFAASFAEIKEEERIKAEEEAKRKAEEEAKKKAEEEAKKKAAAKKTSSTKTSSGYTIVSSATVDDSLVAEGYSTLQAQVFALTNAQRSANGNKSPYVLDATLCAAAMERATELPNKFSHYRPDGSYYTSLLHEYGVYAETVEIIAWGYGTPAEAIKGWMNSTPHRRAILDLNKRGYHLAGVGVYNTNGTYYWIQYFSVQ